MRWSRSLAMGLLALGLALGCGEAEPEVTPVVVNGPRPDLDQAPSEYVTNPHANLRDRSDSERAREQAAIEREARNAGAGGGGGGGGGGREANYDPSPADPVTQRDVEAYRRELERENQARIDDTEDPCDQFRDTFIASLEANRRPGEPAVDVPSRREMRAPCRDMPAGVMECMDRQHYREHREECDRLTLRMSNRGNRMRRTAQRALDRARQNNGLVAPARSEEEEEDEDALPIVPDELTDSEEG